jgi:hypothetical protein
LLLFESHPTPYPGGDSGRRAESGSHQNRYGRLFDGKMQGTELKKKVMLAGNQPSPGPGETLTMEKQKEKSLFWF